MWYAFTSPHVLMVSLVFFLTGSIIDGLSYFTPSIVNGLGYTAAESQLLSVLPFVVSAFVCLVCAFISDKFNFRGPIAIFCSVLCIMGFQLYLATSSVLIKYASLMLTVPGAYSITPALSAWIANNSAPQIRRATATSFAFVMSNAGGIMVAWLYGYLSSPPKYEKATLTLLLFSIVAVFVSCLNLWYLHATNSKKRSRLKDLESHSTENRRLGDRADSFTYCL